MEIEDLIENIMDIDVTKIVGEECNNMLEDDINLINKFMDRGVREFSNTKITNVISGSLQGIYNSRNNATQLKSFINQLDYFLITINFKNSKIDAVIKDSSQKRREANKQLNEIIKLKDELDEYASLLSDIEDKKEKIDEAYSLIVVDSEDRKSLKTKVVGANSSISKIYDEINEKKDEIDEAYKLIFVDDDNGLSLKTEALNSSKEIEKSKESINKIRDELGSYRDEMEQFTNRTSMVQIKINL